MKMSFVCVGVGAMGICATSVLFAAPLAPSPQATAPSSVTPQSLRPQNVHNDTTITIPESDGLRPPAGAENLLVRLDNINVEGAFPEVGAQINPIINAIRGKSVTLAQIYAAASAIEAAHARAGYVLARVAIPPQDIKDGGTLRIVVLDGYIESIDVEGVPTRVRGAVAIRANGLIGKRHLKLNQIEQPLLITNDVPGLIMTSTLTRGSQPGGTKIILNARHRLIAGSIGADNNLSPLLGRFEGNAQLSLNSVLGFGEIIYGFTSSGYDISRFFTNNVPVRVVGGGVVVPLDRGRLSLNPEATFSRTQSAPIKGSLAPESRGDLRRLTVRGDYILQKMRTQQIDFSATLEQVDERSSYFKLGFDLSHDRFAALRAALNYSHIAPSGASYAATVQLSQGLGHFVGLRLGTAANTTPYSRQGSSLEFTKLNLSGRLNTPFSKTIQLSLLAKAQSSFGKPIFRSEQTALEGPDALSALVGGETAVDEAVIARAELTRFIAAGLKQSQSQFAPYLFVAAGAGRVARPTLQEFRSLYAATFGAGLRASIAHTGLTISAEYGRSTADIPAIDKKDRLSMTTALRF